MGIVRAETIARMRGAVKAGLSASRFIADMKEVGLSYRRTDMLADWRREIGAKEKKGLVRFVRKDRYPSTTIMAGLAPTASKEFLYKVKVWSVTETGVPVPPHFVNIMSAAPMTPAMVEAEVEKRWGEWERYKGEELKELQTWSAYGKGIE